MTQAVKSQRLPTRPIAGACPEDRQWDAFVASHPHAHLLQLSCWSALKCRFGWRSSRVALTNPDGDIEAGAALLYRRIARLTIAYAPRGPLTDWADRDLTTRALAAMAEESRRNGAALLKIEPELLDSLAHRALLRSYGFVPSSQTIQPRSTTWLDLSGGEDAVLGRMKSKWRYNVRLAERKAITVRELCAADLHVFYAMMGVTGVRDGFAVHDADYYAAAFQLMVPQHAAFLMAEYAGEPLAGLVVAVTGRKAWYLWGASTNRERNRMPNHALQWAAMRWAMGRGAHLYDFWGIPDAIGQLALGMAHGGDARVPVENLSLDLEALPEAGLWGVYRFKQGFGGEVVAAVGAWDLPLQPVGYRLYQLGLAATRLRHDLPAGLRKHGGATRGQAQAAPQRLGVESAAAWRQLLAKLPAPHVLQSWEWGEVKRETGWRAERWALLDDHDNPSAAFQFLWRQPIPGLRLRLGYVPKGPVVDWVDQAAVLAVLDAIQQRARQLGCIFVKLDPDVRTDRREGQALLATLHARGWRFSGDQVQFQNTAFSDLTLTEDDLLAGMKSKWRYNIRLAARRGIVVRTGAPGDLGDFYRLYAETGQRDGFLIRPYTYYHAAWTAFLAAESEHDNLAGGALLLAVHPDDPAPVAGLFLMRYGVRAWYFYGASSDVRRRDMPNYLLQWEALRWAKAHGCTLYDWWGAPLDPDAPHDPLYGVWQFKQGFGAQLQPHIGAWDFPVFPRLYWLYTELAPRLRDAAATLRPGPRAGHEVAVTLPDSSG